MSDVVTRDAVKEAFVEALDLEPGTDVEKLEIGANAGWDSLGHMALVAELERRFSIELETDELIEMSSFSAAIEILKRHGVEV